MPIRILKLINLALAINLLFIGPVMAMSSQNYQISQDSINFGGSDDGNSANYQLDDTFGELGTGQTDSANFSLESGYRQNDNETPFFSFNVAAADKTTKIAYTNFGSSTVTLASAPNFAVDDYVAVTADEGASQKVAVGRVTAIAGNTLSVDFWSGDFATMPATPAGGNDFVYKLAGHAFDMGFLSQTQVSTAISFYHLTTSARNGYSVGAFANHVFRTNTGAVIANVADGAVNVGSGEYGIRTTGDDVVSSVADMPVQLTSAVIASSSVRSEMRRGAVIYKASSNNDILAGHYTQTVTYIATLNF